MSKELATGRSTPTTFKAAGTRTPNEGRSDGLSQDMEAMLSTQRMLVPFEDEEATSPHPESVESLDMREMLLPFTREKERTELLERVSTLETELALTLCQPKEIGSAVKMRVRDFGVRRIKCNEAKI